MVDIHCHILPGVDDGPENMEEALEMARKAVRCGVTDLVATSHFRGDGQDCALLQSRFRQLSEALEQEGIPLKLHPGAEILCLEQTGEVARAGKLPTIGDTGYVLCEFCFDNSYDFMDMVLEDISNAGYRPIIAHPERYHAIRQNPGRIRSWVRRGYIIQVNKGSVLGTFGPGVRAAARQLLNMGFVHVLASDAHSAQRRTTDLRSLRKYLLERYPPGYIRLLLEENPGRLVRGEQMAPMNNF